MQGKSALGIVRKYYPKVIAVFDAKKPVSIEVTAADCKSSRRKSPDSCALAKAFQKEYDGSVVSLSVAYLIKGDKAFRYKVPNAIARELVSFDRHHDFAEGTYRLNAPNATEKLQPLKRKLNPHRHAKKYSKNKVRSHKTAGIRSL